jgi:hypothetical protein
LVGTKLEGQDCWLKGVAFANFRCNGLSFDELPFYFFVYGCLIPTQGKTQIILLLDAKMHLVLWFFFSKRHMPYFWTDNLPFSRYWPLGLSFVYFQDNSMVICFLAKFILTKEKDLL